MAMSEETKKKISEGRKKQFAEKKAEAQAKENASANTFTQDQVDEIVARAVEAALAKQAQTQQAQVIQVSTDTPMVRLRFQCECSPVNVIQFGVNGKFGSITGKSGTLRVPKDAFVGEFRDELVQRLLETRELIVIDGLTDDERELYGVSYRNGEYLDEKAFNKMVDMGEEILDVYMALNETYKDMVAKRFAEEYEKNPKRITRELVVKLNNMSKVGTEVLPKGDVRKKGAFINVIEAMNKDDASEE